MDDDPTIAWQSLYCLRPYNVYRFQGVQNPAFDRSTDGRLLDFKEGQEYAIAREAREIALVLAQLDLPDRVLVAVIPGHEAKESNLGTPLAKLAERLADQDERLTSVPDALIRYRTVTKLASGGDRSVQTHLNSIRVNQQPSLKGECVILLDDIATTGSSMEAARSLLKQASAVKVAGIAIARTVKLL